MSEFDDRNIAKTLEETDKKCPDCAGIMEFDPKTGGLFCPYCGHIEAIPLDFEEAKKAEELSFLSAENVENCNWGVDKKTVLCKACGGESIYDALQTSATCPFCGSNQVMEANTQNTIAPGGVVPFQISDKDASECFHKWIKKKWFCPKMAKESAKAKAFNGVYLPYWTFDASTDSEYQAKFGKDRTVHDRDGKTRIETDWFRTSGAYHQSINDELVLATMRHDSNMLKGLEPFLTENNKVYKPEYVAGFVSERYSVGLKLAWDHAKESIENTLKHEITSKIKTEKNADHVSNLLVETAFYDITYKYLMLPVWFSNFKYKDKIYQFMVNGQTGKVAGKTPISVWKVLLTIFIVLLVLGAIWFLGEISQ